MRVFNEEKIACNQLKKNLLGAASAHVLTRRDMYEIHEATERILPRNPISLRLRADDF